MTESEDSTMSGRKRGLGRGLDALLSAPEPTVDEVVERGERLENLPLETIRRGRYQPRREMDPDALEALAHSIRMQGVVQPVVVRPVDEAEGEYELIAGERRWRAAQMAELETIPAVIRPVPDQAAMAIGLIENIQREQLNPLEEAFAFHRLIEEFELTHHQVAEAVGRSRVAVTNYLRLLELTGEAKELVENGQLDMGHARALLAVRGGTQIHAARKVVESGLSVRETERLVQALLTDERAETEGEEESAPASGGERDADVQRLERSLAERLGAPVKIQYNRSGKGRVVISYNSLDELDGILRHVGGDEGIEGL
jgi:ParB family chromosome partitioning protein